MSAFRSSGNDARGIVPARNNRDFVEGTEIPKAWAVSFTEHPFE